MLYVRFGGLGHGLTGVLPHDHRDTLVNPVSPSIRVPAVGQAGRNIWDETSPSCAGGCAGFR